MTNEQIAADYYPKSKTARAWVRVYQVANGQRRTLYEGPCEGKREARLIASNYDATPWNF